MHLLRTTPILNVSSLAESFAWFEKLGWKHDWDWGEPPDFGAVICGEIEIFLCVDGQGCRSGPRPGSAGGESTAATWMAWWVTLPKDVDAVNELAVKTGVTVTQPPADMPWNVRECHLRHPDGHVFRVMAKNR